MTDENRRKTVPDNCPLSDMERDKKIQDVLDRGLHASLDKYFKDSPFAVQQEQHYQDHEAMRKLRYDLDTVKATFIKSLIRLLVAACAGAISCKAITTYMIK